MLIHESWYARSFPRECCAFGRYLLTTSNLFHTGQVENQITNPLHQHLTSKGWFIQDEPLVKLITIIIVFERLKKLLRKNCVNHCLTQNANSASPWCATYTGRQLETSLDKLRNSRKGAAIEDESRSSLKLTWRLQSWIMRLRCLACVFTTLKLQTNCFSTAELRRAAHAILAFMRSTQTCSGSGCGCNS